MKTIIPIKKIDIPKFNFQDRYNINKNNNDSNVKEEMNFEEPDVQFIEDDKISSNNGVNGTYQGDVGRTKIEGYSEEDLKTMARVVQREASIDYGRAGTVAVAEEIRNRILSNYDPKYMPDNLHDVLYAKGQYGVKSPLESTEDPREDVIELCRNVLDGTEWVFGQDNVLSHASHSGTDVYDPQKGISNSNAFDSFYYDDINRTQTFFTIGEPTEITRLDKKRELLKQTMKNTFLEYQLESRVHFPHKNNIMSGLSNG